MAPNFIPTLSLLSCLLIFTFSFQTCVESLPSPSGPSDKVSLETYYDSLHMKGASVSNEMYDIVDLHLSPWGNVRLLSNKTIECQHGEKECFLNTIAACAIHVWPDKKKHFYLIHCVELPLFEYVAWDICFNTTLLDRRLIDECYRSGLGSKLELKYAEEAPALKPPLQYTPWLVVDGKPIYEVIFHLFVVPRAEASTFGHDKKETSDWKKAEKLILVIVVAMGAIFWLFLFVYGAYKLYMRFKKIRTHPVDSQEDEH